MLMSLGRNWWCSLDGVYRDIVGGALFLELNVAMRRDRSYREEERTLRSYCIVQKGIGFAGKDIG